MARSRISATRKAWRDKYATGVLARPLTSVEAVFDALNNAADALTGGINSPRADHDPEVYRLLFEIRDDLYAINERLTFAAEHMPVDDESQACARARMLLTYWAMDPEDNAERIQALFSSNSRAAKATA